MGLFNTARGKTYSGTSESVTKKSSVRLPPLEEKKGKKVHFPIQLHNPQYPGRILERTGSILNAVHFLQRKVLKLTPNTPFMNQVWQHRQKAQEFMKITLYSMKNKRKLSVIK